MIGERYAGTTPKAYSGRRTGGRRKTAGLSRARMQRVPRTSRSIALPFTGGAWQRWTARPTIASPQQLLESLGQSVLVQLMLAMTFIALAALLYLAQASQASVLQYRIADLQAERTQLQEQNADLQAMATGLQSIPRIDWTATQQLHMVKQGISNTVWVKPVTPGVAPPRPLHADTVSAQQLSQPLAWMKRFFHLIKTSL